MNAVHLIGIVENQPELRKTHSSGQAVVNVMLTTHETWRDKDGSQQQRSYVHRLVFWGRAAEVTAERVQKGDVIGVDGKLQTREYVDKTTSQPRRTVEVTVTRLHLIDEMEWYDGGLGEEPEAQVTAEKT